MTRKRLKERPIQKKIAPKKSLDKTSKSSRDSLHNLIPKILGYEKPVRTEDVLLLQQTLGNRTVHQILGDGGPTIEHWPADRNSNQAAGIENLIVTSSETAQRATTGSGTTVIDSDPFFAWVDPKNDKGIVFSRPVTIDEAKGYLFNHPPSSPSAVLPDPTSIVSLGHFTRFMLDTEDGDVVYGLRPAHLDMHFRPKESWETKDLASEMALYEWLTPEVREAVLSNTLEEGITYFDGEEPYGIIIAVKDGPSLEFWQEFPEDYDFLLEASGGNETLAKMRYEFYREFNADMREMIEESGRIDVAKARVWRSHRERAMMILGAFANAFSSTPLRVGAVPMPGRLSKPAFGAAGKGTAGKVSGTPTRVGTTTRKGPFGGKPKVPKKPVKERTTLKGPFGGKPKAPKKPAKERTTLKGPFGGKPKEPKTSPSGGAASTTTRHVPLSEKNSRIMSDLTKFDFKAAFPGWKYNLALRVKDYKLYWRKVYGGVGPPPKYGYMDYKSKTVVILSPDAW